MTAPRSRRGRRSRRASSGRGGDFLPNNASRRMSPLPSRVASQGLRVSTINCCRQGFGRLPNALAMGTAPNAAHGQHAVRQPAWPNTEPTRGLGDTRHHCGAVRRGSHRCGTSAGGGRRTAGSPHERRTRGPRALPARRLSVDRRVLQAPGEGRTAVNTGRPVLTAACSGCSPGSAVPAARLLTVSENASYGTVALDRLRVIVPRETSRRWSLVSCRMTELATRARAGGAGLRHRPPVP